MPVHHLDPGIPDTHRHWSDDDYAGRMLLDLAEAGRLELAGGGVGASGARGQDAPDVQAALVDALLLGIEWARRQGWPLAEDYGLRLDWGQHGFLYLMLRAAEGISTAHWSAVNQNPARAMEQLNFALGYLIDYCHYRGWPLEEAAAQALGRGGAGAGGGC